MKSRSFSTHPSMLAHPNRVIAKLALLGLLLGFLFWMPFSTVQASPTSAPIQQSGGYEYTVQRGDSWITLAKRTGLTISQLKAANPSSVRTNDWLRIGETLFIPYEDSYTQPLEYIVAAGDSWAKIAQRYDTTVHLLQGANPRAVRSDGVLYAGESLLVPSYQVSASPTAVPYEEPEYTEPEYTEEAATVEDTVVVDTVEEVYVEDTPIDESADTIQDTADDEYTEEIQEDVDAVESDATPEAYAESESTFSPDSVGDSDVEIEATEEEAYAEATAVYDEQSDSVEELQFYQEYRTVVGDTWEGIAAYYGVSVHVLKALNPQAIYPGDLLYGDEILYIPVYTQVDEAEAVDESADVYDVESTVDEAAPVGEPVVDVESADDVSADVYDVEELPADGEPAVDETTPDVEVIDEAAPVEEPVADAEGTGDTSADVYDVEELPADEEPAVDEAGAASSSHYEEYYTQEGETWESIAAQTGMPAEILQDLNPAVVREDLTLLANDLIYIPLYSIDYLITEENTETQAEIEPSQDISQEVDTVVEEASPESEQEVIEMTAPDVASSTFEESETVTDEAPVEEAATEASDEITLAEENEAVAAEEIVADEATTDEVITEEAPAEAVAEESDAVTSTEEDELVADEAPAEEIIADEATTDEVITEEAPAEAVAEESDAVTSTEEDETVADEAPAEEIAADETTTDEVTTEEATAEVVTEESDEVASTEEDELVADEAPAEEIAADETTTDEVTTEEATAEVVTEESDEVASTEEDELVADEAPAEEIVADEATTDEVITDEAPAEAVVEESDEVASTEEDELVTDEAPAEEIVAEATTDEATTDEAPAEAVVEESDEVASTEEDELVADEAPAEEIVADETTTDEVITEEAPAEAVTEESDEVASTEEDELVADEAPAEEIVADEAATDEVITEEAPAEAVVKESDEVASTEEDEAIAEDASTEEAVTDESDEVTPDEEDETTTDESDEVAPVEEGELATEESDDETPAEEAPATEVSADEAMVDENIDVAIEEERVLSVTEIAATLTESTATVRQLNVTTDAGPLAGLPPCPDDMEYYPEAVTAVLNMPDGAGALSNYLNSCGALTDGSIFGYDWTNDGVEDMAVVYANPDQDAVFPKSDLLIFNSGNGGYTLMHQARAGGEVTMLATEDINSDSLPDLVWKDYICGASTCFDTINVRSWDGWQWHDWTEGSITMAYAETKLADVDPESPGLEIILSGGVHGSVGAGPQRERIEVWGTANSIDGLYTLHETAYAESDCLYHTVLDANQALVDGTITSLDKAKGLYAKAASDTQLTKCWDYRENELEELRSFSWFRMALVAAYQGQSDTAAGTIEILNMSYPNSIYDQVGQVWLESYQANNDVEQACQDTILFAEENAEAWEILANYGYANLSFSAEEVCPNLEINSSEDSIEEASASGSPPLVLVVPEAAQASIPEIGAENAAPIGADEQAVTNSQDDNTAAPAAVLSLPECPSSLGGYGVVLEDVLAVAAGDTAVVEEWMRLCDTMTDERGSIFFADVNEDDIEDAVLSPTIISARGMGPGGAQGAVFIYHGQKDGRYQLVESPPIYGKPSLLIVDDLNGDDRIEIAWSVKGCADFCVFEVQMLRWDGEQYVTAIQPGAIMAEGAATFESMSGNSSQLVLQGGASGTVDGGLDIRHREFWQSIKGDRYQRVGWIYDREAVENQCLGLRLVEANVALEASRALGYGPAIELYTQALSPELEACGLDDMDPNRELELLSGLAAFRLVQSYAYVEDWRNAGMILQELNNVQAGSLYAQATQEWLDAFLKDGDAVQACQTIQPIFNQNIELWKVTDQFGYNHPALAAEQICYIP